MIVHWMGFGLVACGKHIEGIPKQWPADHRWSSDPAQVNCPECKAGMVDVETFVIAPDGKSITCLRCQTTSHHPTDVEQHYCARCKVFHDDLWPPCRAWWLAHPDPVRP